MELKNKRVYFLGDSITQGVGASSQENRYTDVFARNTGATVLNFGLSATRIARQTKPSEWEQADRDFIMRSDEMPSEAPDVLVVFGGTNDFGHGDAPFGSFDDKTEYTFYGALHILFRKLIEKYPTATIVIMTPLHRLSENVRVNEFGIPCQPLSAYVAAEKEVAAYYSLPVLDLWSVAGMQPVIETQQTGFMPDGLHPNDAGARRIAERLQAFLTAL